SRTAALLLGAFLLTFALLSIAGVTPRVPRHWEPWLSPVAGLVAGVVGGITNVPGTPLVIYFHALGLAKRDFLSSVSFTFVVYKIIQLGAVVYYGLLSPTLLGHSLALTLVALGAFALGLKVQDRLEQRTFNRLLLGFLCLLGIWLVARNL
ncbi:MAG TPA: TSUP family transporter, partial [Candidatus Dormibacteraeota bacterium]|nr:TSUP family transporter [Candidatus Dormibacteraeota bacterium]